MNAGTKIRFAVSLLVLSVGTAVAAGPSKGPANPGVDASALARAEAKLAHALEVVDQFKAQAAAEGITGDAWRFDMIGNLMQGAEANFPSVSLARSYADAVSASMAVARAGIPAAIVANDEAASGSSAASVAAGLGTATSDLVYVPITPCRILDTRAGGPPVATGIVKTYIFGAVNVGKGACVVTAQIPGSTAAAAFAANVTVDETGITGFAEGAYLQIYPQGSSTGTSFMNFGPNQIIANAGIISLNQANGQFSVVASAPSQVIVDNYGVFIAPQPTALECTTTAYGTAITLNTTTRDGYPYPPSCPAGYTQVATMQNAIGDYQNVVTPLILDGSAYMRYNGSTSVNVESKAKCCRVPGRN
jgi:hypothetical protein